MSGKTLGFRNPILCHVSRGQIIVVSFSSAMRFELKGKAFPKLDYGNQGDARF